MQAAGTAKCDACDSSGRCSCSSRKPEQGKDFEEVEASVQAVLPAIDRSGPAGHPTATKEEPHPTVVGDKGGAKKRWLTWLIILLPKFLRARRAKHPSGIVPSSASNSSSSTPSTRLPFSISSSPQIHRTMLQALEIEEEAPVQAARRAIDRSGTARHLTATKVVESHPTVPGDKEPRFFGSEVTKGDLIYTPEDGGYSDVSKGTLQLDGEEIQVAIKIPKDVGNTPEEAPGATKRRQEREWRIVDYLKHRNILTAYGIWKGPGPHGGLVMPLCDGNLPKYLKSEPSPAVAFQWWLAIIAGVAHMHSQGIAHGDLKPENIMMDKGVPKIGDFGLAYCLIPIDECPNPNYAQISTLNTTTKHRGSPRYRAPELVGIDGIVQPTVEATCTH